MSRLTRRLAKLKSGTVGAVLTFFRAGRSIYVLLCGVIILALGIVVLLSSLNSREALASNSGWDMFVAMAGTNQWMSASFLISSACVILSINYLPRLEGEA